MKKVIFIFTIILGVAMLGFAALIWYAGKTWDELAVYDIQNNPTTISHAKQEIFTVDHPCLTFIKGRLYHGQDTFEVMKFQINLLDPSWNVVSNAIYATEGCISTECNYTPQLILRDLADDDEQAIDESSLGLLSVYLTHNKKTSHWYLYVVGRILPPEKFDLSKHSGTGGD